MRAAALLALLAGRAGAGPIVLGPTERILFYGDSITEQNLYSGLVETFLVTRYPDRNLAFFNRGWSGDTARGGNARWKRDAGGTRPTLVFTDFGMNDGAYGGFDDWILDAWLPPLKGILEQAAAGGARTVLLSPSVTDPHDTPTKWLAGYSDTLARMAEAEVAFGRTQDIPVVDLFTPMRASMARARSSKMATMVPDGIHPNMAGALLMAWSILRRFEPPSGPGDLTVAGSSVTGSGGVRIGKTDVTATRLAFDLALPYLPFWVPWEARPALEVCTFTGDLNRFHLVAVDWPPAWRIASGGGGAPAEVWLLVDGRPVGRFEGRKLAAGVDLTTLDSAPWARTGRAIWELAKRRNQLHFEAWRDIRLNGRDWGGALAPGLTAGSPAAVLADRQADMARMLDVSAGATADQMRSLAQPHPYHVELLRVPPFARGAGLPKLVEGFEDSTLAGVSCWDESVAAASVTQPVTEGARALQVAFDAAVYGNPGVTMDFPMAQDFSDTPKLSIDAALLPGSLPAGSTASAILTLNPEEPKGKGKKKAAVKLKPVELHSSQTLSDGGHATLVYDLTGASPAVARRTASVTLTLTFSPTGGRGAVVYDNLRALP